MHWNATQTQPTVFLTLMCFDVCGFAWRMNYHTCFTFTFTHSWAFKAKLFSAIDSRYLDKSCACCLKCVVVFIYTRNLARAIVLIASSCLVLRVLLSSLFAR